MKKIEQKVANKNSKKRSDVDQKEVKREGRHDVVIKAKHASALATSSSFQLQIDKLRLAVDLPTEQVSTIHARLKQLVRDGQLKVNKRNKEPYRHAFHLQLSGDAKAGILLSPIHDAHSPMILVLNPAGISKQATEELKVFWKRLFVMNALEMVRSLKFARTDVAGDFAEAIDELIIDLEGSVVAGRIYYRTNGKGRLQTIYMGDVNSPHHGAAYDQDAADAYKIRVGEKPSRELMEDSAELLLKSKKGRLRLEQRLLFSPAISFAQFAQLSSAFGKYRICKLKPKRGVDMSLEFLGYVECVRLRGVAGARKFLLEQASVRKKEMKVLLQKYEGQLGEFAVEWFKPDEMSAKLLDLLLQTPVWQFLKPMKRGF